MSQSRAYFHELTERTGNAWNRFWFTPSDPFTLCVVRVLTAAVALALYLSYIPDLEQWFGPDGLLSENTILKLRDVPVFSIFDYASSTSLLWAFYWIGAAALALFLIGLFTRVTAVLALVAVLSLIHRGPVLARPVDDIVALMMFYLCLGPCGAALSIDALLNRRFGAAAPTNRPVDWWSIFVSVIQVIMCKQNRQGSWAATVAIRLMQVHVSVIYFLMAVAKLKIAGWWGGTAVWPLIAKPESRLIDLTWLSEYIYILNIWTLTIVAFELCFSLLIWNRLARPLLLGLALPIWIGTAVLTGMTSWVLMMLIANLAFVAPACFRNCLDRRSAGNENHASDELESRRG